MPASAPAPIGTSEPLVLNDVWTRTKEPIFRQVSVPGTYQKPAPYRLQIFTYSTGLALTGRSAACAPATATRPAAPPRRRLLTIFIVTSKVCPVEGSRLRRVQDTLWKVPLSPRCSSEPLSLTAVFQPPVRSRPSDGATGAAPLRRASHTRQGASTRNEETRRR